MELYVIVNRYGTDMGAPIIKNTKEEALIFLEDIYNSACIEHDVFEEGLETGIFMEEDEHNVASAFIDFGSDWWEYIVFRVAI